MNSKIALILTPSETLFLDPAFIYFSPLPLSLGVLQGFLQTRGFSVHSTDLNTYMDRFAQPPDVKEWLPLYNKDLVLRYFTEGIPTGMEEVLDYFIQKTEALRSDIVGISTGANMSFFEIHLAFLLGCRIQEQAGKIIVFGGANLDFLWQFREIFHELWDALTQKFSYIFIGPGERSFAELITGIIKPGTGRPYRELPGAVYRENGQVIRNPEDAATLVKPDFKGINLKPYTLCFQAGKSYLEDTGDNLFYFYQLPIHLSPSISEMNRRRLPEGRRKEVLFIPYVFNRNCTYRCAFCVQSRG